MIKKLCIAVAALIVISSYLIIPEKAFAGAWTTPKNQWYTEFYNKYSVSDSKFNSNWQRQKLGWDDTFKIDKGAKSYTYDFAWKNEYGLADWFDVLLNLPFEFATYKEFYRPSSWGPYTVKSHDIKGIEIGGKVRLTQEPMVVSFQMLGNIGHPEAEKIAPAVDKGDSRIELRMLLGKSYKVGRMSAYSGFESGYRFRSFEKVANDIPVFFETGVVLLDWLMVQGELDNWFSVPSNDGTGESYGIARVGLIYSPTGKFNQFRSAKSFVNIGFQGGWTVWGRNTNAGWEMVGKISTQFDVIDLVEAISTRNHENTRDISHTNKFLSDHKNDRTVTHN